jgi:translation initiation factor IF-2
VSSPDTGTGLTRVQRREFVDAFVEQTWARPDADRPVARVQVVVLVATMSAVVAMAVGVVLHLIHPTKPAAAAPPPVPTAQPYSAVSGWDCGTSADRGFDANGRTPDWLTVSRGGWSQDGCHGTFEAIPMSGDAGKDSPNQFVVWWFAPSAGMNRCEVKVYLPTPDNPLDSAATAAHFLVLAGRGGTEFAQFNIDQTKGRGSWKSAGIFPVSQGGLAVKLVNRGAPTNPRARLSVTQVRVSCTS